MNNAIEGGVRACGRGWDGANVGILMYFHFLELRSGVLLSLAQPTPRKAGGDKNHRGSRS